MTNFKAMVKKMVLDCVARHEVLEINDVDFREHDFKVEFKNISTDYADVEMLVRFTNQVYGNQFLEKIMDELKTVKHYVYNNGYCRGFIYDKVSILVTRI